MSLRWKNVNTNTIAYPVTATFFSHLRRCPAKCGSEPDCGWSVAKSSECVQQYDYNNSVVVVVVVVPPAFSFFFFGYCIVSAKIRTESPCFCLRTPYIVQSRHACVRISFIVFFFSSLHFFHSHTSFSVRYTTSYHIISYDIIRTLLLFAILWLRNIWDWLIDQLINQSINWLTRALHILRPTAKSQIVHLFVGWTVSLLKWGLSFKMARSYYSYSGRRQKYYWPNAQLNVWILIMLATGATILGVFASFITIQQQMDLGIPW